MAIKESIGRYVDAHNQSIRVDGVDFAYRDLGPRDSRPLVLLNHWGAVLDNVDPGIVDGLASEHRVIAIDYRGIGGSSGIAPLKISDMARDTISLIQAFGFPEVDLIGISMGGFVAQEVTIVAPHLVRKLILAGTGPAGGKGIDQVGATALPLMLKAFLTLRDPKYYLFFTSTSNGRRAARDFLNRLKQRKIERDTSPSLSAFLRQLKAIKAWGQQTPHRLERINIPVLIANGDSDIMVPTELSHDIARRIPNAKLVIYEDAGHGGVFQYHQDFVKRVLLFLAE